MSRRKRVSAPPTSRRNDAVYDHGVEIYYDCLGYELLIPRAEDSDILRDGQHGQSARFPALGAATIVPSVGCILD